LVKLGVMQPTFKVSGLDLPAVVGDLPPNGGYSLILALRQISR